MTNHYCFKVSFHKDASTKKLKIDYALFPVELVSQSAKSSSYHSKVSDEEPFELPARNESCHKKKDRMTYVAVIKTDLNNLEEVETTYILEIERRIRKKIPFRFRYKKKLKERLARIIDPTLP